MYRGKVSHSKVRAITRIATPENVGYLLYIAIDGLISCDDDPIDED